VEEEEEEEEAWEGDDEWGDDEEKEEEADEEEEEEEEKEEKGREEEEESKGGEELEAEGEEEEESEYITVDPLQKTDKTNFPSLLPKIFPRYLPGGYSPTKMVALVQLGSLLASSSLQYPSGVSKVTEESVALLPHVVMVTHWVEATFSIK